MEIFQLILVSVGLFYIVVRRFYREHLFCKDVERLEQECAGLKKTVEKLKAECISQARKIRQTISHENLDHLLLSLLKISHPDRWNQGQHAEALAHELAVAINEIRQKQGETSLCH